MLKPEKIAIFFDTNYLYTKKFDSTKLNLDSYFKFVKTLEFVKLDETVELFVPELVLCELLSQHKRNLKKRIRKSENPHEEFKSTSLKNFDEDSIENYYKDLKEIHTNEINIIRIPFDKSNLFNQIFQMAIDKKPPFPDDNNLDNGFKDSILLLSIFDYVKFNNYDAYILVTNDGGFTKNVEELQNHFAKEVIDVDKNALKFMKEDEFNRCFYSRYGLFTDLRNYLDKTFFWDIEDNYSRASYISVDHDLPIGDYNILYDNTRIFQLESDLFEVEIFISIEPNYDEDPLLVPYEETIHQKESFLFKNTACGWKYELYDYYYNVDYEPFVWNESFLNDEYP